MKNRHESANVPVWAIEAVEIQKNNPKWLDKGAKERETLYKLLSPFGIKEVEHIGSTSIPHLPAKPIIDLMASISSMNQLKKIRDVLTTDGWHYVSPELDMQPWRRFFVKVKNDKRFAHLHLVKIGEKRWEERLRFRNILRANPYLVDEYTVVKNELAKKFRNDREAYTEAKTDFINRVLSIYHE
ncbi:GrpB family protein [Virgibacillus oceani]|uniref:GrpB family protein n=1 Tax=Virgibacillus oceani TaxID=1479511 RepID=A0A917HG42_9BACI|nr:GrpB family protein [Virgibacillus oceani]GGG78571.1 hypothetical protein GCM10011398_24840 [Virgibacillus oceani]